jgi:predicted O-methyltransferase YrrM
MKKPERYALVTQAIREQASKSILEVGTWNGDRAISMAEAALGKSSKVSYVGFDLFESMTAGKSKAEFNAKTPTPETMVKSKLEAFRAKHGGFTYRLYKGDTRQTLPTYLSQAGPGLVDFVWLDGGHSVETVASDWEHCRKAVRPGGIILLDDFYANMAPSFLKQFGCNTLVDRLRKEGMNVKVLPIQDPVLGGGVVQIVRVDV